MANQPETATYDAGVYQLQTTDPVQGGVGGLSNTPLLNLANRTAYLKVHVDALESSSASLAPINSPTFTGTPAGPTPAAGDGSTKFATTAFVNTARYGIQTVAVSNANVTLSATQYGAGIIVFSGTLTANINIIFPVNGQWTVINNTTGAFSITCKTAAGTGIVIAQGKSNDLIGDATNIVQSRTDFTSVALTGTPTAPTAAAADNSTAIATTAYVTANALYKTGGTMSGTLTGADGGLWSAANGFSGLTKLGVGMVAVGLADFYKATVNGANNVRVLNDHTGTGSYAQFQSSNGTNSLSLTMFGTSYTTAGVQRQNGGQIYASGAGGLTLSVNAANIYFTGGASGVTQFGQFEVGGCLQLGTTRTPSSGDRLEVGAPAWLNGLRVLANFSAGFASPTDTGIPATAVFQSDGVAIFALVGAQISSGNGTGAALYMLRLPSSGTGVSVTKIAADLAATGSAADFAFTVSAGGNIQVQAPLNENNTVVFLQVAGTH